MATEIELKLETTAEGYAALLAPDSLTGLLGDEGDDADGGACDDRALHAVYFDTPAHELHDHGHSLRIRQSGGKAVQTVKTGDVAAGLFARGEWELPVAGTRPVADLRTPVSDILATRRDELVPVFEVPVQRRTCRLRGADIDIELAIDRAEVSAGERRSLFHEVELELRAGSGAALFALARRIDALAPVRLSVLSKAERGYRLRGALPVSVRAEAAHLDPAMPLPDAFAVIAGSCLRQYRLNEAILLDRIQPEAVHQARIGLRRLRSAITLFKELLTGSEREALVARVRDLARVLGDARDLDVLSAEAAPGPLHERLVHARDAAHAALRRKLKSREARRLMLDLSEWVAAGSWRSDPATQALRDKPLAEFAADALDRVRRKTAKHGRHLAELDPEQRHRLRKDAKKLRYAVEFLSGLFDAQGKVRKFGKALEKLQDELGALNDLATARQQLAALGLSGTAEVEEFLGRWQAEERLEKAVAARGKLLAAKPFWR